MIRAWLKRGALWLGLALCTYALWQSQQIAGDAIGLIHVTDWALVAGSLSAAWLLAVMTWRQYLIAYTDRDPGIRTAARQLGLLLVGKYVPGGAFGFLARLYDQPTTMRDRLFWAGLAEQAIGTAIPVAFGALLIASAFSHTMLWLSFVLVLPPCAAVGVSLLHRLSCKLPWLGRRSAHVQEPDWQRVVGASALQLGAQAAWVVLIFVLVRALFALDIYAALGIAGAFWLAVAGGMLALIVPGGIGVREAVLIGLSAPWLGITQALFLASLLRILSMALDIGAGTIAALLRQTDAQFGNEPEGQ